MTVMPGVCLELPVVYQHAGDCASPGERVLLDDIRLA